MRTLGVDLSANPRKTAVAVLDWQPDRAELVELRLGVLDEDIISLIAGCDYTGIDCPLGWPAGLLPFLQGHIDNDTGAVLAHDGPEGRRTLAYRQTDRFVAGLLRLVPMSVSADRLGHVAMRCAVIQAKAARAAGPARRDGSDGIAEVYPAASLRSWGIKARKYKGTSADARLVRESSLRSLRDQAGWLRLKGRDEQLLASDDLHDALVASLTARAAAVGKTYPVPAHLAGVAAEEGWIHVPNTPLAELL
ncbi:DUF429 domain-containing protein [Arthrobacter sp. I2-34]|uniref:DUF429 domain-containing protein n=1 Tax=Arthrobacter hankyongi TaxID=2904801 RepID=A0ABS9L450_9MICC|nr:DUF429 domain-containing protein [Arthrobacter hankyongi]MCG2621269.1 DUF429 domain-containing protein [Arthrobacter hankyongi]